MFRRELLLHGHERAARNNELSGPDDALLYAQGRRRRLIESNDHERAERGVQCRLPGRTARTNWRSGSSKLSVRRKRRGEQCNWPEWNQVQCSNLATRFFRGPATKMRVGYCDKHHRRVLKLRRYFLG